MSDYRATSPTADPEKAAHEVVLELCKSGAFGLGGEHKVFGAKDGESVAEAIIAAHEKITAHYKSLT